MCGALPPCFLCAFSTQSEVMLSSHLPLALPVSIKWQERHSFNSHVTQLGVLKLWALTGESWVGWSAVSQLFVIQYKLFHNFKLALWENADSRDYKVMYVHVICSVLCFLIYQSHSDGWSCKLLLIWISWVLYIAWVLFFLTVVVQKLNLCFYLWFNSAQWLTLVPFNGLPRLDSSLFEVRKKSSFLRLWPVIQKSDLFDVFLRLGSLYLKTDTDPAFLGHNSFLSHPLSFIILWSSYHLTITWKIKSIIRYIKTK
jgi:hypothetical protein